MSAPQTYADLSVEALRHQLEREALRSLHAAPGLDWLVERIKKSPVEKLLLEGCGASCLRAGEGAYPELAGRVEGLAAVLGLPAPTVYLAEGIGAEGRILGWRAPALVLAPTWAELVPAEDADGVPAHLLGRWRCGQLPWHLLLETARGLLGAGGERGGTLAGLLFALEEWSATALLSADRAALLAVTDPQAYLRHLARLAGGGRDVFGGVQEDALTAQAREAAAHAQEILRPRGMQRPFAGFRPVRHLALLRLGIASAWVETDEFAEWTSGTYPRESGEEGSGEKGSPWSFAEGQAQWEDEPGREGEALRNLRDEIVDATDTAATTLQRGAHAFARAMGSFWNTLDEEFREPGERGSNDA